MITLEPRIYLASRSPRRRELLAQIGVRFELLMFRGIPREDPDIETHSVEVDGTDRKAMLLRPKH